MCIRDSAEAIAFAPYWLMHTPWPQPRVVTENSSPVQVTEKSALRSERAVRTSCPRQATPPMCADVT